MGGRVRRHGGDACSGGGGGGANSLLGCAPSACVWVHCCVVFVCVYVRCACALRGAFAL